MTSLRFVRLGGLLGPMLVSACAAMPNHTATPTVPSTPMADATIPSGPTGERLRGTAVHASVSDGDFELTIRSAQHQYRAGQPINVEAVLMYRGGSGHPIWVFADRGLVGFALRSSDGSVDIGTIGFGLCEGRELDRMEQFPFQREGGWSDESPPFVRSYFEAPDDAFRLPAGTWTVRVRADFHLVEGCIDDAHFLTAEIPIVVVP